MHEEGVNNLHEFISLISRDLPTNVTVESIRDVIRMSTCTLQCIVGVELIQVLEYGDNCNSALWSTSLELNVTVPWVLVRDGARTNMNCGWS